MATGMSLPSFKSATSRGDRGASQANKRLQPAARMSCREISKNECAAAQAALPHLSASHDWGTRRSTREVRQHPGVTEVRAVKSTAG